MTKYRKFLYPLLTTCIVITLFFTRFLNLSWGLPFPFHPDERNMANALAQLRCDNLDITCLNPHFFAYGQLPLYIGYFLIQALHLISRISSDISFNEAVLSLRFISVLASTFTFLFFIKIIEKTQITTYKTFSLIVGGLFFIFSPVLIQFAHFGTTESLLLFLYTVLIYLSIIFLQGSISIHKYLLLAAITCGFALATKISSYSFVLLPFLIIINGYNGRSFYRRVVLSFFALFKFGTLALFIAIIFSPHNFISFQDFLGSIRYESEIGFGNLAAFYTRQFQFTLPVIFQFSSIFPYVLGSLVFILFCLGFIFVPRKKEIHVLRLAFILYFVLNAFVFTKWTRFMAAVYPVMIIMAVLFLIQLYELIQLKLNRRIAICVTSIIVILSILPGIAFLSVYKNNDVRFTASEWIYSNIPSGSVILQDAGNVVDLPIVPPYFSENQIQKLPSYIVIPFNFYDVDQDIFLQDQLKESMRNADYIIVPSRRVFANHTCLKDSSMNWIISELRCSYLNEKYPIVNDYFRNLFSGNTDFKFEKEISSTPTISVFNKALLTFNDENAEETWSVFDHPTIRIYKRMK